MSDECLDKKFFVFCLCLVVLLILIWGDWDNLEVLMGWRLFKYVFMFNKYVFLGGCVD